MNPTAPTLTNPPVKPFATLAKAKRDSYPRFVVRVRKYETSDWEARWSVPACPQWGGAEQAERLAANFVGTGEYAEVEIIALEVAA